MLVAIIKNADRTYEYLYEIQNELISFHVDKNGFSLSDNSYINKLNHLGIVTYKHYEIEGYPHDISKIISEEGFGKNEYIKKG